MNRIVRIVIVVILIVAYAVFRGICRKNEVHLGFIVEAIIAGVFLTIIKIVWPTKDDKDDTENMGKNVES